MGVIVGVDCREGEPQVEGSHLLLAVGRIPIPTISDLIGPSWKRIRADTSRLTNSAARTCPASGHSATATAAGVTHTSYNDFEIVVANLLDNDPRKLSDRIPCYALYTDPPLGRVGMTETEVKKTGRRALLGLRP